MLAALLSLAASADAQSQFEVVAAFDAAGETPPTPPRAIQAADGNFYGTRRSEAFKVDAAGTVTVLHQFRGADGSSPSRLVQGADGDF